MDLRRGVYPWLLGVAAAAVLFGNSGFRRLTANCLELRRLKREYSALVQEEASLHGQLDRAHSGFAVESAARRELGFVKPGEIEYRFPPPKN